MKRRALFVLLCAALMLTLLPIAAFAAAEVNPSLNVESGSIVLAAAASVSTGGEAALNWYACDQNGAVSGASLAAGGAFAIPTTLTKGTCYYL